MPARTLAGRFPLILALALLLAVPTGCSTTRPYTVGLIKTAPDDQPRGRPSDRR